MVSSIRANDQIDLSPILNSLAKGVLRPKTCLEIPQRIALSDGARAHAVLRCVQEIITNTVKHSGANNLWITVRFVDDAIEISARDDGHASRLPRLGAGLTGMKERFESLGGCVEFRTEPDAGFVLHALLPAHPQDKLT